MSTSETFFGVNILRKYSWKSESVGKVNFRTEITQVVRRNFGTKLKPNELSGLEISCVYSSCGLSFFSVL